jgi:hypothetical protein
MMKKSSKTKDYNDDYSLKEQKRIFEKDSFVHS